MSDKLVYVVSKYHYDDRESMDVFTSKFLADKFVEISKFNDMVNGDANYYSYEVLPKNVVETTNDLSEKVHAVDSMFVSYSSKKGLKIHADYQKRRDDDTVGNVRVYVDITPGFTANTITVVFNVPVALNENLRDNDINKRAISGIKEIYRILEEDYGISYIMMQTTKDPSNFPVQARWIEITDFSDKNKKQFMFEFFSDTLFKKEEI